MFEFGLKRIRNILGHFVVVDNYVFSNISGNRNHMHMQKRDSKSFDSGSLYRPEMLVDDYSNCASDMDRIERTDRNDGKIMLPTPPIRKTSQAHAAAAMAATTPVAAAAAPSSSISGVITANQSDEHNNMSDDRNKTNPYEAGDNTGDNSDAEQKSSETLEVRLK